LAAHPGNDYALKLDTPELRREAYRQYCDHIASGLPKEAFVLEHPDVSITWETMDKYIRESPKDFPPVKMQRAKAKRYRHWLEEGRKIMAGKYKNGSPVVWQIFMRNIFKDLAWDRDLNTQHQSTPEMMRNYQNLMSLLAQQQGALAQEKAPDLLEHQGPENPD
jgi:hypothetical protein